MLLIGSRAARFHFPSARKPKDFDFIASPTEAKEFLKNFRHKDTSKHEKKIRATVDVHGEIVSFEFDLNTAYVSSMNLYTFERNFIKEDSILGIKYYVASPHALLLLKKSHITFPIHWQKNIEDYLFLKDKVNNKGFPAWWNHVFTQRFSEIKNRTSKKQMNFDVENSEFFKKSERFVNRVVEHDSLHYATCFGSEPLFLSAKDDLGKAALSAVKVANMSTLTRIRMIQEECMALSMERYIIPAMMKGETFDKDVAYQRIAGKMVYNYLPEFLRFFAADNYREILDLKIDYVNKCLTNHPTLAKVIRQGYPQ